MNNYRKLFLGASLVIAIVAFVAIVFGIGDHNRLIQAHDARMVLPDRMGFFKDALFAGRLPLWNSHTLSGSPFLANPATAIFYPTSLLFLGLSPSSAIVIQLIAHLLLGAFGMYLLAHRTYGLSVGAALFAGMLYALSGRVVGHGFAGHSNLLIALAYIPMLAYLTDRAVASFADNPRGGPMLARFGPWPWIAGLLLGLQIFSGGLPMVWLGMIFVGLLRVGHVLTHSPVNWRSWSREAVVLALITGLGLMLAAIQLLPSYEFALASNRPRSWQYASSSSFNPTMFTMMFNPRATLSGNTFFWEFYGYLGLLPLALGLTSLSRLGRDRRILILACIGLLMVMFMLGKYFVLFPLLWKYVPTFDIFRVPARALVIVHLIMALLAAFGIETVMGWLRDKKGLAARSIMPLVVAIFLITWLDIVGAARWYERWLFKPVNADLILNFDTNRPEIINSRARHARVLSEDSGWYRFWFDAVNLRRNYAFENGGHSIGGYDLMMLNRYSRFMHFMTFNDIDGGITFPEPLLFKSPVPFPLKILGLKYMNHEDRLVEQVDFPIRRAWFAGHEIYVGDEVAALEYIRSDRFRRFDEVVIEDDANLQAERSGSFLPADPEL